jgi:iduronate 2-sulfatase
VIADDAVLKLRLAAAHRAATGQPFFMAVGLRKPHLAFRFPEGFLGLLPPLTETDVAAHPTLDRGVPPLAHHDASPQASPYVAEGNHTAQNWRQYYRAAIAWMDTRMGRVLAELEAGGNFDNTLVVMHSDHGWSLGEHGEWQKFSNFEHGTRVPLVVRAPWLPHSAGARTGVLAELIDVWPTMADVLGVPLAEGLADGVSLLPVLEAAPAQRPAVAAATKQYALSQYMRCPARAGTDPALFSEKNACLFQDRSQTRFMGYSLRTAAWRYTEWARWNGDALLPEWTAEPCCPVGGCADTANSSASIGCELYTHVDAQGEVDDGSDFDSFENANQALAHPDVVQQLSALLRAAVANTTRIWPSE